MLKKLLYILVIVLVIGVVAGLFYLSWRKLSVVPCSDILVKISKHSPHFADEKEISDFVLKMNPGLLDTALYSINVENIEKQLRQITSLKKTEVYRRMDINDFNFKGRLVIDVEQREPLFRVMGAKDFYMDREGVAVYETEKHPANVMLVTGEANEVFVGEKLLPMMIFLEENEFWNTQIQQINVSNKGELEIVPLVGDHIIEFGDSDNFKAKFRNLKALYEQGFKETGWGKYKKISLKYENQIVCTRK